jgi:hypothetical protein
MSTTTCDPDQYLPPAVAKGIFDDTLSAMGGYELLRQSLEIRACYLCRGMDGELIMCFDACDLTDKVKIELSEEIDMYTMTFYRFSRAPVDRGCQVVEVFEDVGREQLGHSFEEFTGLSLVPK